MIFVSSLLIRSTSIIYKNKRILSMSDRGRKTVAIQANGSPETDSTQPKKSRLLTSQAITAPAEKIGISQKTSSKQRAGNPSATTKATAQTPHLRPSGQQGEGRLGSAPWITSSRTKVSKKRASAATPAAASASAAAVAIAAAAATPVATSSAQLGMPGPTPATTVMEAQELGELARYRDDAMWSLEGLGSWSSSATRRSSMAALLEICASRRGRLALRSFGLAREMFEHLSKLDLATDPVLALGTAGVLLCFCQTDADPKFLQQDVVVATITALLKVRRDRSPQAQW